MPLPVPRLDDRTFDQLVAEGRSLIPRYSQSWTNFNPSDPGITLLELFAHLTETGVFQLDQLPPETLRQFLALAGIPPRSSVAAALDALADEPRAITLAEIEALAVKLGARRAHAHVELDPVCGGTDALIVALVPGPKTSNDDVFRGLKERALLGTRLYVVTREEVRVGIAATVVAPGRAPGAIGAELVRFLDPLEGGEGATGWPFGRWVFRSELFQRLEGVDGVDHVERLEVAAVDEPRFDHPPEGVEIPPGALPRTETADVVVTVRR